MYKPINGWTKDKILAVIRARPFDGAAMDEHWPVCSYLSADGNKCFVGLFIPDGHPGQKHAGGVGSLSVAYPDLKTHMPLDLAALAQGQLVHDDTNYRTCAKAAMLDWVEKNVSDDATEDAA